MPQRFLSGVLSRVVMNRTAETARREKEPRWRGDIGRGGVSGSVGEGQAP